MKAFSPGSVTLFFEIRDDSKDPLKRGSRGVGVCLSKGVITEIEKGDKLEVIINGEKKSDSIQEAVARELGFKGVIKSHVQLPISQGFGMSGAAALSTALAIGGLKGYTYMQSVQVAHKVEILRKSGLGDIASQYEGGFTVRIKEGIHPFGIVDRLLVASMPINLIVLKEEIETRQVLSDERMRERIKKEGARAMERFLNAPTLKNAIKIARDFSLRTGLVSDEGMDIMAQCGNAAIAMIGNSAIIFGDSCNKVIEDYEKYSVKIGERATLLF